MTPMFLQVHPFFVILEHALPQEITFGKYLSDSDQVICWTENGLEAAEALLELGKAYQQFSGQERGSNGE